MAEPVSERLSGVQYGVRGPLLERAALIEAELSEGGKKPFSRVIRANVGDCQALGQPPLTYLRQVLSLAACPSLMESAHFPEDIRRRVRRLLRDCTNASVGSYSPPEGLRSVRERVAEYLERRDGVRARVEDIYLGAGASDLVRSVLALVAQPVKGKPPAVMVPVPQYPLFSGTLTELGVHRADYFLDEERGWTLSRAELARSWAAASREHHVRAIVVINPGNPTGQVLSRENIAEIIEFAHTHGLLLLADEVYQENIVSKPFHSFKKVIHDMGPPYCSLELASFMTCSKGWAAECGLRAASLELAGVGPTAAGVFRTHRGLQQCPAVLGQCLLDSVMSPPRPGEPSFELYRRERAAILRLLRERTAAATQHFNRIPGYSCNNIDGAMFAFPRVELPRAVCELAAARGEEPDQLYCLALLEDTGICVVPGSGFGQLPGTFHFRTTILHRDDEFQHMMDSISNFHHHFLARFS